MIRQPWLGCLVSSAFTACIENLIFSRMKRLCGKILDLYQMILHVQTTNKTLTRRNLTMKIEMTIVCNSLKDASMIEEVVKGTASTYSIRTINGDVTPQKAKKTFSYVGGRKTKEVSGKDCILQFAKSQGGKFHIEDLVKHGAKYQFAPSSLSSKVSLMVREGQLKRGDKPRTYQIVK